MSFRFFDENNYINKKNFESVGIAPWLTDSAKYLKIDDGLPLKLFTFENIEKCILSGRIDLAYSLIQPSLLKDAIMDNEFDRLTHIEMLSLGYSIFMLYLCELEAFSSKKNARHQKNFKKWRGKCFLDFDGLKNGVLNIYHCAFLFAY